MDLKACRKSKPVTSSGKRRGSLRSTWLTNSAAFVASTKWSEAEFEALEPGVTGAQITDAEAARMNLRRVISALMPERFWIDNEPSIPKERLARFRYLCH